MFNAKRFWGTIIIFIFLLFSLYTTCYSYKISIVDGSGVIREIDYTSPILNEDDIKSIEQELESRLEKWSYEELLKEAEKLIKERETEKKLEAEKAMQEKEKQENRQKEKNVLAQKEKEYRAEKNKVPNAGDLTILVLKNITIVSTIALVVVIVCSKKMKK